MNIMKTIKLGYESEDYERMFDACLKSPDIQKKLWIYATIIVVLGLLTAD